MFELLVDNIFAISDRRVFKKTAGFLSVSTMLLFSPICAFIVWSKHYVNNEKNLDRSPNFTFRYMDDVLSIWYHRLFSITDLHYLVLMIQWRVALTILCRWWSFHIIIIFFDFKLYTLQRYHVKWNYIHYIIWTCQRCSDAAFIDRDTLSRLPLNCRIGANFSVWVILIIEDHYYCHWKM